MPRKLHLPELLSRPIVHDRFPLSQRIKLLRAILAKLEPPVPRAGWGFDQPPVAGYGYWPSRLRPPSSNAPKRFLSRHVTAPDCLAEPPFNLVLASGVIPSL